MSTRADVLLVGCGKMAGALLDRWAGATAHAFTVVNPSPRPMPHGVTLLHSPAGLPDAQFDAIVIGLKPQKIVEVVPGYRRFLKSGGLVLSMAAGTSLATLEEVTGGAAIVRMMPNLPVALGQGLTGLVAGPAVTPAHRALVQDLLSPTGEYVWLNDEDALDRFTAIAGSGPGFVFELLRAHSDAATALGFGEAEAMAMVLHTWRGALSLLDSGGTASEWRDRVTSPNGTTAAGLTALNGDGELDRRLTATLAAAYRRAVELR